MKTSVERVDDTTVKLSVTVEAERVGKAIDEAARRLAREVRVPGFRPGKAPRRVLETRLGKGTLVQEAVREALPGFYTEAAQAEALSVVSQPEFDLQTFEDGKDAEFTATVQVVPEFEVPDYGGLQVAHPEWEVTEEEVAQQLDALRERFAELTTVTRPVQAGDHVRLTITGTKDGEKDEDASAEDILYEVGDPDQSEAELDRNLVGAEAGAILKFSDVLGADYGERAGEELDFTCIVKEVKAKQLPDLDDEFALTASEFDTIDELREALSEQLSQQKLAYARQALRGKVVEAVADLVEVPLPEALVQQEVGFRVNRLAQEAQQHGFDLEQYLQAAGMEVSDLVERFEEEARETVKAQLVLDAIGRKVDIKVDRDDLGAEISRQAARFGRDPQELAELMTHPDRISALFGDAFRRKTIDHLLEQVQVLSAPPAEVLEAADAGVAGEDEAGGEVAAGEAGDEADDAPEPATGDRG